ncbi:MAG: aconitate hydratase [Gemmatimonadota bacterium]|nr:MAG: aconitate hydratase [Gemmatimonadota bacterium]
MSEVGALAKQVYSALPDRIAAIRTRIGRPLTYAEKVVFSHLRDPQGQELKRGKAFLLLHPDRVAMQDATAQMALLQFMMAGRDRTAVPSTVHCDHLILAESGAAADTANANKTNSEVYQFLEDVSRKYGIGFWKPGAGIIHQVVLENYAFPGGLMIGTDSHTPNAGGLGMIAVGVGGADAVDVMAGMPWEVLQPKLVGIRLTGEMSGWTSAKDVILKVASILTVKGGTNRIVEYFGPGVQSISATGKATITNMGAELGATTSIFPYDERSETYLRATRRAEVADMANGIAQHLRADDEVLANPQDYFDEVVEIDLSTLQPHIVGPHTPDLAREISQMAADVDAQGYPEELKAALIGSCTNSSYEDISRAAHIARQAAAHGIRAKSEFLVTPGSDQIYATIQRDGQMDDLNAMGASVLANACGPCIGQWKRHNEPGKANSILTSYNRNFPKRNDGNPDTLAFIGSPEIVTAMALAGTMKFNPLADTLTGADGKEFRLEPPTGDELPANGFLPDEKGFIPPSDQHRDLKIQVSPTSERLQLLTPFDPWDGKDFERLPLLLKAKGKCTTDHISPAGPWLRFRGHLDAISDNMFSGAVNDFGGPNGTTKNLESGETEIEVNKVARDYKKRGLRWVVVGDENYGEGSSREHAAMCPRLLGAAAVIVRGFARIHETNLKKQGVLPLTFANPADYDQVQQDDRVSVLGLAGLRPGSTHTAVFHHADGSESRAELNQSLNAEQIEWFRAGSALNLLRASGSSEVATGA